MGPRRIDNPGGGVFNPHSSLVPVNNQMVQFSVICLRINFYTHGKSLVRRYRGCTRGKMQIIQSAKCSKSRKKKITLRFTFKGESSYFGIHYSSIK